MFRPHGPDGLRVAVGDALSVGGEEGGINMFFLPSLVFCLIYISCRKMEKEEGKIPLDYL